MMLAFLITAARAACPEHALAEAMDAEVKLELAFAALDDDAFDTAAFRLDNAIPCINEPISVQDALVLHRAKGLSSFVFGKKDDSRAAWGAIRALQPDAKPPQGIMPVGHPLLALWNESAAAIGPAKPFDSVPPGGWTVDGLHATEAPLYRAYVLQGFDATGGVLFTGWYPGGGVLPDLPGVVMESTAPPPERHTRRWVATGLAGGLVVGAGVAGLGANGAASHLETADNEDVPKLARDYQTLGGVAIGLGVAGAATATIAWVMPW